MIFLRDLTLRRGTKLLFERATISFLRGQKIGVTGANGAGKSSLFSLIKDDLHPDVGDIEVQPRLVFGEVAQDLPYGDRPAIEYVLDGDDELRVIEARLLEVENSADHAQLGELHEIMAGIGGYAARSRAARLMNGLGFAESDLEKPIDIFSGGWRVRLNLARALMARSDLLLLDEPTNHLDLDAIIWLEGWLRSYAGTLLLISHDREFLDNTVDSICHLEARGLRLYPGNYSAFERQRAEMLSQQMATYEKQQREIAHMRAFVERFRAKATKARQAQSRVKALAKFDEILPAHVNSPFEFAFRNAATQADPALVLDDVSAGYDGHAVLSSVRMTLRAGERIGLLGRNGAGKSTLIKLLAGDLAPLSGTRVEGKDLAIGYFEQRQLDQLREEDSPLQHLVRLDPKTREQELRNFLGGFDFRGDAALAPVGQFSGGERSRLALALIAWQRPNVLLLDEPTNHLDIEMRHALTRALQEYVGAMVLVSHDRSLLRTACDELYLVERGSVREFDGDLESYRQSLSAQSGEQSSTGRPNQSRKEKRRAEAEARAALSERRRPVAKQVRHVEEQIETLSMEKERVENLIASPDMYGADKKEELLQYQFEQARIAERLEMAEERWLELSAQLESLDAHE